MKKMLRYLLSGLLFILVSCGGGGTDIDANNSPMPGGTTSGQAVTLPNFGEPKGSAVLTAGVKVLSTAEIATITSEDQSAVIFTATPSLRVGDVFISQSGAYKVSDIARPDASGSVAVTVIEPPIGELFDKLILTGTTDMAEAEIVADNSDKPVVKISAQLPSAIIQNDASETPTRLFATIQKGAIAAFTITDLIRQLGLENVNATATWKKSDIAFDYLYEKSNGGLQKAYIAISPVLETRIQSAFKNGLEIFKKEVVLYKISRPVPISIATSLLDAVGIRLVLINITLNVGVEARADFGIQPTVNATASAVGGVDYKKDSGVQVISSGDMSGDVSLTALDMPAEIPTGATINASGKFYLSVEPALAFLKTVAIAGTKVKFNFGPTISAEINRTRSPLYCLTSDYLVSGSVEAFYKGIGIRELTTPPTTIFSKQLPSPTKIGSCLSDSYFGTFSGTDSGTFKVTIESNGQITGAGVSTQVGEFTISGAVSPGGQITFSTSGGASTGASFTGTLNSEAGTLQGSWVNMQDSGSFTAKRDVVVQPMPLS